MRTPSIDRSPPTWQAVPDEERKAKRRPKRTQHAATQRGSEDEPSRQRQPEENSQRAGGDDGASSLCQSSPAVTRSSIASSVDMGAVTDATPGVTHVRKAGGAEQMSRRAKATTSRGERRAVRTARGAPSGSPRDTVKSLAVRLAGAA